MIHLVYVIKRKTKHHRMEYKLIYFVLHPMMFCIASDDVLKNKLIYFVPQSIVR